MTLGIGFLVLLGLALVCAGLWLLQLPNGYRVERRQQFARSRHDMQAYVLDYQRWQEWSPWLLHDPQTELHFFGNAAEIGSGYGWQSARIGQGEITTDAIEPGRSIKQTLKFFKPFKSQAQVCFEFHEVANEPGACELRWVMEAKVPLPMRPFLPMFKHMIGMDFELGLARMVGALDATAPHPRITFIGVCTRPAQAVIKRSYSGLLKDLPGFFAKAYPELSLQAGDTVNGQPLALYHKINTKDSSTHCEAGLPVSDTYVGLDAQATGAGKYFHVRLQGDYRFLGTAWNAAMGHARMQKYKLDKRRPALEVYTIQPGTVASSNDLVTELFVPIR